MTLTAVLGMVSLFVGGAGLATSLLFARLGVISRASMWSGLVIAAFNVVAGGFAIIAGSAS